jgi:hypothetical protein
MSSEEVIHINMKLVPRISDSGDSSVSIAVGWMAGVPFLTGARFFSTPSLPDWGPPCLLSNGYYRLFPPGEADGTWRWPLSSILCQGQEWWHHHHHHHHQGFMWGVSCPHIVSVLQAMTSGDAVHNGWGTVDAVMQSELHAGFPSCLFYGINTVCSSDTHYINP